MCVSVCMRVRARVCVCENIKKNPLVLIKMNFSCLKEKAFEIQVIPANITHQKHGWDV